MIQILVSGIELSLITYLPLYHWNYWTAKIKPPGLPGFIFLKIYVLISLISDTLLSEQLIYETDFWNWTVEKGLLRPSHWLPRYSTTSECGPLSLGKKACQSIKERNQTKLACFSLCTGQDRHRLDRLRTREAAQK